MLRWLVLPLLWHRPSSSTYVTLTHRDATRVTDPNVLQIISLVIMTLPTRFPSLSFMWSQAHRYVALEQSLVSLPYYACPDSAFTHLSLLPRSRLNASKSYLTFQENHLNSLNRGPLQIGRARVPSDARTSSSATQYAFLPSHIQINS